MFIYGLSFETNHGGASCWKLCSCTCFLLHSGVSSAENQIHLIPSVSGCGLSTPQMTSEANLGPLIQTAAIPLMQGSR